MKRNDIKELTNKTIKELKEIQKLTEAELVKLKLDLALKKTKNVHAFYSKRKDLARIKTIIREKELVEKYKKK